MARPLPAHLSADDLREVILDHVDTLLARYGYARFTMDDVARSVGIGKGTVYLQFRTKEEMTLAVIDRIVLRVEGELSRIAAAPLRAAERLRRMLEARVLERHDRLAHYQGSLQELVGPLRPALQARREEHGGREAAIFATVIADGAQAREFVAPNALASARLLMTATEGLLPSHLTARELSERPVIAKRASALAALLVAGLQIRNPAVKMPRPKRAPAKRARSGAER